MNDFLWQTYHRLITETVITTHRFLFEQLNLQHRLMGIVGPRGVGKTTLLLQFIKENLYESGQAFYFSADNAYFNEVSLLEFVDQLYRYQKITFFLLTKFTDIQIGTN